MDPANKRVFITHGKNQDFIEPIKKVKSDGKYDPVVAQEKQSVSNLQGLYEVRYSGEKLVLC